MRLSLVHSFVGEKVVTGMFFWGGVWGAPGEFYNVFGITNLGGFVSVFRGVCSVFSLAFLLQSECAATAVAQSRTQMAVYCPQRLGTSETKNLENEEAPCLCPCLATLHRNLTSKQ